MPHLTFDRDERDDRSRSYSAGTGGGLRTELMEVTRLSFESGTGAEVHAHPEEQVMYVLSGRLRVACGDDTYVVGPGEATFNPANMPHGVTAVEDTVCLSVKSLVAPVRADE